MKGLARMAGAAAVLVALAAPGSASAIPKLKLVPPGYMAPVAPGSTYLALGDSVTFGYEESQVVPAPDYHVASSFIAYPQLVAEALKLKVVNAACPGETAASLINAKAPSNGCESTPHGPGGYRTTFPLHVHYPGSQLAFAVHYLKTHPNVRLVSLMIGANDAFLCQETTADGCKSELPATLAKLKAHVAAIVAAIRHFGGYTGQIVIVNYYSLNYGVPAITAESTELNNAADAGAKSVAPHVLIADGFGVLGAAALHSGGDTCAAGLLTQVGGGKCGIHPSVAGQTLLAQAVENVITP